MALLLLELNKVVTMDKVSVHSLFALGAVMWLNEESE